MNASLETDRAEIFVFKDRAAAENAVALLRDAEVPLEAVSVVGGAETMPDAALGAYKPPAYVEEGLKHEEEREGAMVGGALGLLAGIGVFVAAGVGALIVLGPLVGLVAGAGIGAGLGELYGGLTFKNIAAEYRRQLLEGNYLLIMHCSMEDQDRIKGILDSGVGHSNEPRTAARTDP